MMFTCRSFGFLQRRHCLVRHVLGHVDLARLERGHRRGTLGDDAEIDDVELRLLVADIAVAARAARVRRVAVVAHQPDMAVRPVFLELVGTRPDDLGLAGVLRGLLGGDDRDDDFGLAEIIDEERTCALELERHRVGIRRRDFGDVLEIAAAHAHAHVALDRGLGVGRIHHLAVVEGHALAQLDRIEQPVGRHGPALREHRRRLELLVAADQRLVDMQIDDAAGIVGRRHHVERRQSRGQADAQRPASARRLRLRGCEGRGCKRSGGKRASGECPAAE